MKRYFVILASVSMLLALSGCKSSESAYKKAYEKAKAQEEASATEEEETTITVVAPVEEKPASDVQVVDNSDNVQVRQENVSLVSGAGLKAYSVVVGSFSLKANAEGLQQRLKDEGYDAQIAQSENGTYYRVVASTFNDKQSAASSRDDLRSKYKDAWLLYKAE